MPEEGLDQRQDLADVDPAVYHQGAQTHEGDSPEQGGGRQFGVGKILQGSVCGPFDQQATDGPFELVVGTRRDVGEAAGPPQVGDDLLAGRRVSVEAFQLCSDDGGQAGGRVARAFGGCGRDLAQLVEHRSEEESQDVVFVGEVVVHR